MDFRPLVGRAPVLNLHDVVLDLTLDPTQVAQQLVLPYLARHSIHRER